MLRALQCIQDLGITQTSVAKATGWSRTQISLSFRSGKLPVDAERFRASLRKWAEEDAMVDVWLVRQGLSAEALCDRVGEEALSYDEAVDALVIRIPVSGPRTDELLRLVRVNRYLIDTVRQVAPEHAIAGIEATAAGML